MCLISFSDMKRDKTNNLLYHNRTTSKFTIIKTVYDMRRNHFIDSSYLFLYFVIFDFVIMLVSLIEYVKCIIIHTENEKLII